MKKTADSLVASDDNIDNFIMAMGLKSVYNALDDDKRLAFKTQIQELRVRREFRDLRFAEIEGTDDEFLKVYKVKSIDKLTSDEYHNFFKLVYYLLFNNRIFKMYESEYDAIPDNLKSMIIEDKDFHDRLKRNSIKDL